MTNEEINKRVALAMGYSVEVGEYDSTWGKVPCYTLLRGDGSRVLGGFGNVWGWGRCSEESDAWSQVPSFCTNPAAAEILRSFIESLDHGRLWIDERSYPHDFPRRGEQEGQRVRRYSCIIRGSGRETWQESFCETRGIALALAFLKTRAAHEATDTDKDRAGDGTT
jgi:hypothetical protein